MDLDPDSLALRIRGKMRKLEARIGEDQGNAYEQGLVKQSLVKQSLSAFWLGL